jgi:hypothetical protein
MCHEDVAADARHHQPGTDEGAQEAHPRRSPCETNVGAHAFLILCAEAMEPLRGEGT